MMVLSMATSDSEHHFRTRRALGMPVFGANELKIIARDASGRFVIASGYDCVLRNDCGVF